MVSVQVSEGTEAKVDGTEDAMMSLLEPQGAVSEANVLREAFYRQGMLGR